ncbi:Fe-S protein assembly co-chaperone HscB [Bdellovibrionota bacterium FG-1]
MQNEPVAVEPVFQHKAGQTPDFFELFSLKRRFQIDRQALERRFYELSRNSHPDRFTTASPDRKCQAMEQMTLLNDAYRTLKDPSALRRYYLQLEGFDTPSEQPHAPGCVTGISVQTTRAVPGESIPIDLAESWFDLQDALLEDPGASSSKIAEFEGHLATLSKKAIELLNEIEQTIDGTADTQGCAPRELFEKLAQEVRAQSYFKSMKRDVERIKKRLSSP